MQTHETYLAAIADIAAARLASTDASAVRSIKLTYGAGPAGVRGVTYYNRWTNVHGSVPFVEISAFNQESIVQVAGTVLHEMAHVIAPIGAGHGPAWKAACSKVGLQRVKAAGTRYLWSNFTADVREAILALPVPIDGAPSAIELPPGLLPKLRPCGAGIGVRGGKSRGTGSGSRLRLWECACLPPVKARVASNSFMATCDCCGSSFIKR